MGVTLSSALTPRTAKSFKCGVDLAFTCHRQTTSFLNALLSMQYFLLHCSQFPKKLPG